jgi:hypothetical protein
MTSELQQTNYTVPWDGEYCSVYAYQLRLDLKFGLSFSFQITENSFRLRYYTRRRVELQNQTLYRDKLKWSRREQALFKSLEEHDIKDSTYVFIVLSNKVMLFRIPKRQWAEKYCLTPFCFSRLVHVCQALPLSFNQHFLFAIHILQVNLIDDAKLSPCITRRSITVKKWVEPFRTEIL